MTPSTPNPFPPEVVAAVSRHMNEDHPEDSLLICRWVGGCAEATSATMVGMDGTGADFTAATPQGEQAVRVPWGQPLTERAQVRVEVVRLYQEACARAGITPRGEGEH